MKVVLVDNLMLPEEGSLAMLDVHPHLGLLALAAVAEADGHAVQIYDPKRLIRAGALPYDATLYERAARDVLALGPRAVEFTTLGCSFMFALNVAVGGAPGRRARSAVRALRRPPLQAGPRHVHGEPPEGPRVLRSSRGARLVAPAAPRRDRALARCDSVKVTLT